MCIVTCLRCKFFFLFFFLECFLNIRSVHHWRAATESLATVWEP